MDRVRVFETGQGANLVQAELFPDISIGDAPAGDAPAGAAPAAPVTAVAPAAGGKS
jgi:hypothetical protein